MVFSIPPTHAPLFWPVMGRVADLPVGCEASIIHLSLSLPVSLWVWGNHLRPPCEQLGSGLAFSKPLLQTRVHLLWMFSVESLLLDTQGCSFQHLTGLSRWASGWAVSARGLSGFPRAVECWDCGLHPSWWIQDLCAAVELAWGWGNGFSDSGIFRHGSPLKRCGFLVSQVGRIQPAICRCVSRSIVFEVKGGGTRSYL